MSKIEQIISEMEEYLDNCKFQPLSNSKIIVNKDEIDDFLDDLRQNIPDEVKKYQRIIANRDAILKDAQDKAEEMIKKANEMTATLVSEHEIMQQAFREANTVIDDATNQAGNIVDSATVEANDIKMSAIQYTDDSLGTIEEILSTAIEGLTVKYDAIMRSLESSLEVTTQNRQALRDYSVAPASEPEYTAHAYSEPHGYVPSASFETKETYTGIPQDNIFSVEEFSDEDYILPEEEPEYEEPAPAVQAYEEEPSVTPLGFDSVFVSEDFDMIDDPLSENQAEAPAAENEDKLKMSDFDSLDEIADFDLDFDEFK